MKYIITIQKEDFQPYVERGPYGKIDDIEVKRERGIYDEKTENEPRTRIKEVLGYPPDRKYDKLEKREIYSQTVETLDMAAVIKAVNGLP